MLHKTLKKGAGLLSTIAHYPLEARHWTRRHEESKWLNLEVLEEVRRDAPWEGQHPSASWRFALLSYHDFFKRAR